MSLLGIYTTLSTLRITLPRNIPVGISLLFYLIENKKKKLSLNEESQNKLFSLVNQFFQKNS